ncbi:hypothetical protein [Rheinheimera sp.]|uniref:hypothetical protein n=1 Tax=Rheinheimera sp. TaxID=1869214 RepID=UPI00307DEDE5
MTLFRRLALACLATGLNAYELQAETTEVLILQDNSRNRAIPVALYFPNHRHCAAKKLCPVALLSPGYGVPHTGYAFIAGQLRSEGYFVVAVQHDLPTDPPLAKTGDLFSVRMPMWQRGAQNLRFVRHHLSAVYPAFDWTALTLIGHSNGGDISALLLRESPGFASRLITLDNRRYPLPRHDTVQVLSVRGSDFPADAGVLPAAEEQVKSVCVSTIAGSRHNDLTDQGSEVLKATINQLVLSFVRQGQCGPDVVQPGELKHLLP